MGRNKQDIYGPLTLLVSPLIQNTTPHERIVTSASAIQVRILLKSGLSKQEISPTSLSPVDKLLDAIDGHVSGGVLDVELIQQQLLQLRKMLGPLSPMQSRPQGGLRYRANYILNTVLLADSLKPIPQEEPDLLRTVLQQILG